MTTVQKSGYAPYPSTLSDARFMETWRYALTGDKEADPSDVVVAELAEYFALSQEDALRRCLNWETASVEEWKVKDRSTPEGLLDFYQTQTSWIFDTMWYHAEQYHGRKPTESVDIASGLLKMCPNLMPGHHLDFGAGPGSSSLFFHLLGWQVFLADISTTFLDFSKWRLKKHGVPAVFYDTSQEQLPAETFALITAFDVIVHVPNIEETLQALYRALKPGGYFIFNIDNQPLTERTASHLYAEQYPILSPIRSFGFRRCPKISYFHVYQKVERSRLNTTLIQLADKIRYNSAMTTVGKLARRSGFRRQK